MRSKETIDLERQLDRLMMTPETKRATDEAAKVSSTTYSSPEEAETAFYALCAGTDYVCKFKGATRTANGRFKINW